MRPTFGERPPYRDGGFADGPRIGMPHLTPAVKLLLQINVAAFLVFWLAVSVAGSTTAQYLYTDVLGLNPGTWRAWFPFVPIWQLGTYSFLHDVGSPFHVLWNMLMLYFFGTMLEGVIGSRRFFAVYFAAALIGGVVQLGVQLATGSSFFTVGASGAILAVVVAMAVLEPHQTVLFLFIPVTLRIMALIMVGIDVFSLLSRSQGGTAVVVHLAGAAYGFVAARRRWIWKDPVAALEERRSEAREEQQVHDEQRLDELLARIHREGMGSLTNKEREFLRRVSGRH